MRTLRRPLLLLPLLLLAACAPPGATGPAVPPPPAATAPTQAAEADPADWLGRWNGPEGTFLALAPGTGPDEMRMTLKDSLDGQDAYTAIVSGDRLRFTRNDVIETVRHGSGPETGFKWLADKRDCLIVVPGREGYCRD